jgi:hypothetical protein
MGFRGVHGDFSRARPFRRLTQHKESRIEEGHLFREYIKNQENEDQRLGSLDLWR